MRSMDAATAVKDLSVTSALVIPTATNVFAVSLDLESSYCQQPGRLGDSVTLIIA